VRRLKGREALWTAAAVAVLGLACLAFGLLRCRSRRPSLSERCCVLITLDTCRADALGCYGSSMARTPNLDELAERGTLFERCLTPIPITLPAHCSLFTGKLPPEHGVRLNGRVLEEQAVTLAEIFSEAGIRTAAFVGSYACSSDFGLSQGFQVYDDPFLAGGEEEGGPVAERTCLDVNAAARRWISAQAEKPFFLWIHYFDPHAPHEAPLPYAAWFPDRLYDAEVAFVDKAVGQLLDAVVDKVGEKGLLVAVVGDHGEGLDDHNEKEHGHLLFDTTVRVPLILAGGDVPKGKRVAAQVRLVDLAPTVQEWLLDEVRLPSSGSSLRPLLPRNLLSRSGRGDAKGRSAYAETVWPYEKYGWSPGRRFSTQDWVLIMDPGPRLFHVESDPEQAADLSEERPEKTLELREALARAEREMTDSRTASAAGSAEGLKELGYVGMDRVGEGSAIPWTDDLPSPTDMIGVVRFERRGLAHKAGGRRERAREEFQRGLALDPTNLELLNELGLLHIEAGEYEQALPIFRRLDEAERDSCMGLINQGICLEALGDLEAARLAYARAVDKDPSSWRAWFNLSRLHLSLGDLDKAESALARARDRAPLGAPAIQDLERLIAEMESH